MPGDSCLVLSDRDPLYPCEVNANVEIRQSVTVQRRKVDTKSGGVGSNLLLASTRLWISILPPFKH